MRALRARASVNRMKAKVWKREREENERVREGEGDRKWEQLTI